MCGIAGMIMLGDQKVTENSLNQLLFSLKHRGPNGDGIFIEDNVGIGNVRLSIIDLSSLGNQPMYSFDNNLVIVFNGEIYNYLELKNQLKDVYPFRSKSDTEVILAAYFVWGQECLNYFNGDFSFVIYDKTKKKIFGARDRYGIKPFYYLLENNRFIFASEIKSLLPFLIRKKPNDLIIFDYLLYGRTDQNGETFFQNIVKLEHGHCFEISEGCFEKRKWYDLKSNLDSYDISPKEYREELKKSVSLRLRSDVPVGVSLSGGIDSSVLTSILLNDFGLSQINSFSVIYGKNIWADESQYIQEFEKVLPNMNFCRPTSTSVFNEFKYFIDVMGEPVSNLGPYGQYKTMEMCENKVGVAIGGQGADEILGGYHNFFGAYYHELIKSLKFSRFGFELFHYLSLHRSISPLKFLLFYFIPSNLKNRVVANLHGNISSDFFSSVEEQSSIKNNIYSPKSLQDSLVQHCDFKLEHLLKWDDLNAMNFSIESRMPFLDHNLVELTLSLPSEMKIKNGITKHILRESVSDILPEKIKNRVDKMGFCTPNDIWFRDKQFQKYIWGMLDSKSFGNRGYFNVEICKNYFQNHVNGKSNYAKEIWKMINLHVWFEKFIEN